MELIWTPECVLSNPKVPSKHGLEEMIKGLWGHAVGSGGPFCAECVAGGP